MRPPDPSAVRCVPVTLAITAKVVASGTIDNTASVHYVLQLDSDHSNDSSKATIEVPPAADLSLTKTVDEAAPDKGTQVTFEIRIVNDGPDAAAGVIVRDQLPTGISYVSSVGAYDPTTGAWTVGYLSVGSSATLTITATVGQTGSITNMAQVVASGQRDPNPDNGEATAVVSAGAATPPPTVSAETGLPAGDPGSLALWVLGLALAGFALMSMGPRAARCRRFRLRR
jgi:uncharacterized repeat protein (TIGR01451 family)